MYMYTYVCMYVCMYVCLSVCMCVGYVHIMAPLRSELTNGACMYHGQVSYGRHMCVSRTALTDLTFTDSSQTNDAFTRAHLIQNKVKNCVMNGWLTIILVVMPVAVMQLAVIILAVMQSADIKLAVMQ